MTDQPIDNWTEVLGVERAARDLWSAVGAADAPGAAADVDVDAAWGRLSAAVGHSERSSEARVVRLRPKRRRTVVYYVAAAVAAIAVLVGVNILAGLGDTDIQYANGTADMMPVRLPDDTEAMLMPGSHIAYAERDGRREVVIAGEVDFAVTEHPEMSFAVQAEQLQILVVGTAFTVNHGGVAGVDVREGHVRVRGRREADWTDVYAGGFARVTDGLVSTASASEASNDALRFDDAPLSRILSVLQDAHGMTFEAAAPLRACRLTVNLSDSDADEAITTLGAVLGAEVVDSVGGYRLTGGGCQ